MDKQTPVETTSTPAERLSNDDVQRTNSNNIGLTEMGDVSVETKGTLHGIESGFTPHLFPLRARRRGGTLPYTGGRRRSCPGTAKRPGRGAFAGWANASDVVCVIERRRCLDCQPSRSRAPALRTDAFQGDAVLQHPGFGLFPG